MLPDQVKRVAFDLGLGLWDGDEWAWLSEDAQTMGEGLVKWWHFMQARLSRPVAPTKDRLVVRSAVMPEMTESGTLYIPEMARDKSDEGVVLGVGGEIYDLHPGDRVLFRRRSGTVLNYQDQEIRVLEYKDVIAKLEVGDGGSGAPQAGDKTVSTDR